MSYLFSSESVAEGHPDKMADQISDAILDRFMACDPNAKVACETLLTTGQVVLAGEIKSSAYVDVQDITRNTIRRIGYTKSVYGFDADSRGILSALHEQSVEIRQAVEKDNQREQGAGDQGMTFGFATNETADYMPLPIYLAHIIMRELAQVRREQNILVYDKYGQTRTYLRPDAKCQITVEYTDDHKPIHVHSVVLSTQHDDFDEDEVRMHKKIQTDIQTQFIPHVQRLLDEKNAALFTPQTAFHINPSGRFVIGGPHGDSGLTGRKIIVDTYGGSAPHGGGAFSGKDPSKVDRSGAYAARHIAKNMVAAGVCDKMLVQIAYAIGEPDPVSIYVDTYATAKKAITNAQIVQAIQDLFPLKPFEVEQRLHLRAPIYEPTARYGHFGRQPATSVYTFTDTTGQTKQIPIHLFSWEKLDYVKNIQTYFQLQPHDHDNLLPTRHA